MYRVHSGLLDAVNSTTDSIVHVPSVTLFEISRYHTQCSELVKLRGETIRRLYALRWRRGLGVRVLTYLGNISPPTLFPRCPTFSSPLRSDVPTSQLSQRVRCVTRYQTGSLCVRVCVWGGGEFLHSALTRRCERNVHLIWPYQGRTRNSIYEFFFS